MKLLQVCSFIDPRFKLKYITEECNQRTIKQTVCDEAVTLYRIPSNSSGTDNATLRSPDSPPSTKRKRTLRSLFKTHEIEDSAGVQLSISPEKLNLTFTLVNNVLTWMQTH